MCEMCSYFAKLCCVLAVTVLPHRDEPAKCVKKQFSKSLARIRLLRLEHKHCRMLAHVYISCEISVMMWLVPSKPATALAHFIDHL